MALEPRTLSGKSLLFLMLIQILLFMLNNPNFWMTQPLFCKLVVMYLSCCTFQPPYTFTYLIISTQTSLPLDVTDGIDLWLCVLFKFFSSECVAAVCSRVGTCQVKTAHAHISQVWRWTPLKIILMRKKQQHLSPNRVEPKKVIKRFKVKMSISIIRLYTYFLTWQSIFILCSL